MVALVALLALQAASPTPAYAARFECTVQSPSQPSYREVVTVGTWQIGVAQPMIEMHLSDGRTITHPGTLHRVRTGANGAFALSIGSTAFHWSTHVGGEAPVNFRSLYFFHHGGEEETTGTCTVDIREPIQEGTSPGWENR